MKNIIRSVCNRLMRTSLILMLTSLAVSSSFGQISLSVDNATLDEVIETIQDQSQYRFFYNDSLADIPVENVKIEDEAIEKVLNSVLNEKEVAYVVEDKMVYLSSASVAPIAEKKQNDDGQSREIKGTVTDNFGDPVIGASIQVKGTTVGTVTNIDGEFTLKIPAGATELEFTYLGFRKLNYPMGSESVLTIEMQEDTRALDEVVVTALGIKRDKKMLGYSIQEMKVDDINQTGSASVTSVLQGKVAGVQMNVSPTGLNGSTKITIRGNSSFVDNNQPLWVVDGIPFNDGSNSSVSVFGGIDRGGAGIDINPDDIETVSILKGPNAAALYGARAGNGVILITTKKGSQKEGLGINYSTTCTWTSVFETLDLQKKYGQGLNGKYDRGAAYSFGGKLDGSESSTEAWWVGGEDVFVPYGYNGNVLKDYFQTGFSQNHNVSISNATEDSHYRTSFGYLRSEGMFEKEGLTKWNFDLNSGKKINKYLTADSKISLSRTKSENRPYLGRYGEMYQLLLLPNNIRLSDLREHYQTPQKDANGNVFNTHQNWIGPTQDLMNVYWVANQRTNLDDRWRMFGYQSLKFHITDWLTASGKIAFDYYRTKLESTDKSQGKGVKESKMNDQFYKGEENFFEMNTEFMLAGHNQVTDKIRLDYHVGANRMDSQIESLHAYGRNMTNKGQWYLNNAGIDVNASGGIPTYANQELERYRVNSVFGLLQFAYDEFLAADITGRWEWSSTLPKENNPFFYPSVNVSFIGTEFLNRIDKDIPDWITFGKLRLSWAKVAKGTNPYFLKNYDKFEQTYNGPMTNEDRIFMDSSFKPEETTSYEAGLDMKFLDNRLGFDFTWYNAVTKNQVMYLPYQQSLGYSRYRVNAGKVQNRGIEFTLYTIPVKTKDFEFSLDINMAHDKGTILSLHPDKKHVDFGEFKDKFFITVGGVEGGKMGDIYAGSIARRDDNGNMIINEYTGLPEMNTSASWEERKIGNIQPDLMMSVLPRFRYKNISMSAFFDMKFGGEIVSLSEAIATHYGRAARTVDRDGKIVIPGVYANGKENTTEITKETYYKFIGSNGSSGGVAEEFVYDASYIKLRELSLSYHLPKKTLSKTPFTGVQVSFVARNLGYLMKHTPGTNPEGGFDTSMYSQAIDYLMTPSNRTFGFSVNLGF